MSNLLRYPTIAAVVFLAFGWADRPSEAQAPPAIELALLVDVSSSIDETEFDLQRTGYADAFRSNDVKNAVANAAPGGIRVAVIFFDANAQYAVDWTLLKTAADCDAFADEIAAAPNTGVQGTGIANAIRFATEEFQYDGDAQIIDVSGDGTNTDGIADVQDARDAALAAGVETINGLAIQTDVPFLNQYYTANVIGGTGAFSIPVNSFDDFGQAVVTKIAVELGGGTTVSIAGKTYDIHVRSIYSGTFTATIHFGDINANTGQGIWTLIAEDGETGSGLYVGTGATTAVGVGTNGDGDFVGVFNVHAYVTARHDSIVGSGLGNVPGTFTYSGHAVRQRGPLTAAQTTAPAPAPAAAPAAKAAAPQAKVAGPRR